jgi:hypothetical protein
VPETRDILGHSLASFSIVEIYLSFNKNLFQYNRIKSRKNFLKTEEKAPSARSAGVRDKLKKNP